MLTPDQLQAAAIPFGCVFNARAAALYLAGRIAGVTDPATIQANAAGFNLPVSDELLALALLAQMAGVTDIAEIVSGSEAFKSLDRAAAIYLSEVVASNGGGGGGTSAGVFTYGPVIDYFGLKGVSGLPILSFPNWVTCSNGFFIDGNPDVLSVSAPLLIGAGASGSIQNHPLLTSIDIPMFVFSDAQEYYFSGNALSQASVDQILAQCVASSGFNSGTVELSGGTNAAPSSVAPGSDYDILINRGVSVTVNP